MPVSYHTFPAHYVVQGTTAPTTTMAVGSVSDAVIQEEVQYQASLAQEMMPTKELLMSKIKDLYYQMMQEQAFQNEYNNIFQATESQFQKQSQEDSMRIPNALATLKLPQVLVS